MLHRGYEVWIADSRKQRLPEYNVAMGSEDDSVITCYIPSESGKQFSIRWKDHNGPMGNHASMRTFVDGVRAGSTHLRPGDKGKRAGLSTDSASVYYPFQFAALETTDDDSALWTAGASEQLGTIELRVVHIRPDMRADMFRAGTFDGVSRVHERSKKAGAHCVALGEAKAYGKRHSRVRTTPMDKHAPPFATFRFFYRPAALLQAQGIMPAPVVRGASRAHQDAHDGQADEKGKGKAHASASARASASVSVREGSDVGGVDRKPVKAELEDTSIHVPPGVRGDVIVLSDDDDDDDVHAGAGARRAVKVKRDPDRRATYDPDDVIDLTLD